RNGNPPGDFLAAPRCGARTRAGGVCRQPGMRNGRCRLHGGWSTGPRTAEGKARCAAARLVRGTQTTAVRAFRSEAAQAMRDMDRLTDAVHARADGREARERSAQQLIEAAAGSVTAALAMAAATWNFVELVLPGLLSGEVGAGPTDGFDA
ncbi:MAG: HGGxSTG domain-containing protein, partial [Dongiaceae bacterium]